MASTVKYTPVFRLAKKQYITNRDGKGAHVKGGRWNSKGLRMIYASELRSLAFCEFFANYNISTFGNNIYSIEIKIPVGVGIDFIKEKDLPRGWEKPFFSECAGIGDKWILSNSSCVLKIPSAIIKEEFNYLLNPLHSDFSKLAFCNPVKFSPNQRILDKMNAPVKSTKKAQKRK